MASMQTSGPRPPVPELAVGVGALVVDDVGAQLALGHLEPVVEAVDEDHPLGPQQLGRPGGHLADRSATPDRDHVARLHPAQVGAHPPGRGRVGGEQRRHVVQPVGDLEGDLVGEWQPHILGVAALEAAHGVGVAEDPGRVIAPHALGDGRVGVAVVAAGEQALLAVPAAAAGDDRADYHPIADPVAGDVRADLDDLAHELVPDHVSRPHEGM
jgi:hypothetical protein